MSTEQSPISLAQSLANLSRCVQRMASDSELRYLSFGTIAAGIELLGACYDEFGFHATGHSQTRFDMGITNLLTPINSDYERFNDPGSAFNLYTHLRCGMAHVLRPAGRVGFTSRAEAENDGTAHLVVWKGSKPSLLVLVAEQFANDFATACATLAALLPVMEVSNPKLNRPFQVLHPAPLSPP